MHTFQAALPVVVHALYVFSEHRTIIDTYLLRIFWFFGVTDPMRLFSSVILYQTMGVEYRYHYRQFYPEIKSYFSSCCSLCGVDTMMRHVGKITNSMASWKLTMIQASMIKIRCPDMLSSGGRMVLDIDVTTILSSSSKKEGAQSGYNKKRRGKPCFQLSATFMGKFFIDAKLYPGSCNPKDHFQKAVRRAKALGFTPDIVRADRAYMTLGNLLFLEDLSLGYALGAPATFNAVKDGIKLFGQLSRKKSSRIVSAGKGVALLDLGEITLENGVRTRLVIVRRISRTKKKGVWKVRTFHYGIATNMEITPRKLYKFYHKRQCIEAGFRELKNHWHLERLPFKTLKANEFWIISKITAMTLFKIFQHEMLPKALRSLLRKTLYRRIFKKGLRIGRAGELEADVKSKYNWPLRRLLCKTARMRSALMPCQ